MSTGKVVCTGRGTHQPREIARYAVEANGEGFVITSKVRGGGGTAHYLRGVGGVERVFFECPSCSRKPSFNAEKFLTFLLAKMPSGATRRDISLLEAALSG